jgi:hypothetical protein
MVCCVTRSSRRPPLQHAGEAALRVRRLAAVQAAQAARARRPLRENDAGTSGERARRRAHVVCCWCLRWCLEGGAWRLVEGTGGTKRKRLQQCRRVSRILYRLVPGGNPQPTIHHTKTYASSSALFEFERLRVCGSSSVGGRSA